MGSSGSRYAFFACFIRLAHASFARRRAFARISGVHVAPFLWFAAGAVAAVLSLAVAVGFAVLRTVPARDVPRSAAIAASILVLS